MVRFFAAIYPKENLSDEVIVRQLDSLNFAEA